MRYRYTFEVVSRIQLAPPIHFAHKGFHFRLTDTGGRFTQLVVETPSVQLPTGWKPKRTAAGIPTFTTPPQPYLAIVQQEVRAIRGALTLWGLIDIDVDQPNAEFLPENDAERSELDLFAVNLKRQPRTELPMIPPVPDMLVRCILARGEFAKYEVPFEFFRRGSDDCYHRHFVEAIFNFFFVLEYLIGGGKFKATQLELAFASSDDLRTAFHEAQKEINAGRLRSEVWARKAASKYGSLDFGQVVKALVSLRGFLHHQSLTRTGNWNPGTQIDFEPDAQFLHFVCQPVLMKFALAILFDRDAVAEFLSVPVKGPAEQTIQWHPQP